ncbi:TetR/AcrR family transcriptional regulator [Acaryochloris marina]|uniref:Transcriptional regulator, TetR family, putative n=1 Tax=Acaryochloris marina (strain MBIC 11017) TaxID=329726 RepID=B0CD32_ACAM1|nr:TetR/AcrR family transcriptional regulator [Acaryochloris marina]ABW25623.1 transcriptional regulator, TetR family, putative [Acaryochloris marina MBIC11017]BDM80499.1 TetR family transcriptional regulator [Acaryochloris marina MBIC10699]
MKDAYKKSPGRPRSVSSQRAMLKATLELLAEVGFEKMSMDAIATRAGIGKTTIYRRYANKDELVADAIESVREEIRVPDTGNLWGDMDALIENATQITLTPLGKQAVAMIISSASSNAKFARVYWEKYLLPRKQAFASVIERAKVRQEVASDVDAGLVFDTMSGIMLYALIFPPEEAWTDYIRRSLSLVLRPMPK